MPEQILLNVVELLVSSRFQDFLRDFNECDVFGDFQVRQRALHGVTRFTGILPGDDNALARIASYPVRHNENRSAGAEQHGSGIKRMKNIFCDGCELIITRSAARASTAIASRGK